MVFRKWHAHEFGGQVNTLLRPLELRPGMTVADIGSGPGRFTIPIAKLIAPGEIYAIDVDEDSLEELQRRAKEEGMTNVNVVRADVTKGIPLPEGLADLALLANVLHDFIHEGASQVVLSNVKRLLKPGGRVAVFEFKPGLTGFGPPPWLRVVPDRVVEELRAAGLTAVGEPIDVANTHYLVIAKK
ncbi:MAG: class I SAM-dependent methyltransferase [Acidilobus sp.]